MAWGRGLSTGSWFGGQLVTVLPPKGGADPVPEPKNEQFPRPQPFNKIPAPKLIAGAMANDRGHPERHAGEMFADPRTAIEGDCQSWRSNFFG
jgi:hypothetical protein